MKIFKISCSLAIFVLLMFPNFSNAQEPQVTLEFENAESAQQLVKNYVAALQKGDIATMSAQLSPDAMIYGLGGGLDSLTVEQHNVYFTSSTATFKHNITQDLYLPVKVTDNWNEGEWILCWGMNTITDKKTGLEILIPYHIVNRIENGKIVFVRYYYDLLNIGESQGFSLTAKN